MPRAGIGSILTCLAVLCGAPSAGASPDASAPAGEPGSPLRLGSDVWTPFTDFPGHKRVAIELVQAALARSGIEATTRIQDDFEGLMRQLRRGELDGSVALWRTPEREGYLLFSKPYLENRLVLLTRKGGDANASGLAALAGKRVALVEGYAYGKAIEEIEGPVLVWGPSDQENLERLLRGEVDYLLADEVLIHSLFERYGTRAQVLLDVGSTPIVERSLHFAVRRDLPGAASIIDRFEQAIAAMIADGSYNRALGMTWIRADVDGDGRSELVLGGDEAGVDAPAEGYDVFASHAGSGGASAAGSEEKDARYVVEGRIYDNWTQIPSRYRVPIEREVDRQGDGPEPGITFFHF